MHTALCALLLVMLFSVATATSEHVPQSSTASSRSFQFACFASDSSTHKTEAQLPVPPTDSFHVSDSATTATAEHVPQSDQTSTRSFQFACFVSTHCHGIENPEMLVRYDRGLCNKSAAMILPQLSYFAVVSKCDMFFTKPFLVLRLTEGHKVRPI